MMPIMRLYTPISSMPEWAQWIAWANPVTHFIEVLRMVVIKGSGWHDIIPHLYFIIGFAVIFFSWAIYSYKKQS